VTSSRTNLAFAAAAAITLVTTTPADAAPKKGASSATRTACIAAHEDAQALRTSKKPHAAREKFVACARAECPTVVRKECVEQLSLVEREAPTVAIDARDEGGNDTTAVKVFVDGAVVAERLTGGAIPVEPGEHAFRFEREGGKVLEQKVLVVEGDKNKKVVADFTALAPKPPADAATTPTAEPRKIPVASYVLGGVSLAALGSFTIFALSGKGEESDLASSCGARCTDDQLSGVRRDYLIADISLVVAVASAAVAVVLAWPALTGGSTAKVGTAAIAAPAPSPWLPRVKVRALP